MRRMEPKKMGQRNQNSTAAITNYALLHLADVGGKASELGEELLEDTVFAQEKSYNAVNRQEILRKQLVGVLGYIAGGYRNLFVAAVIARREQTKKKG